MATSRQSETMSDQLTFSLEEPHAKTSASPDCELDWLERVATSRSNILNLLGVYAPAGWSGRTSPVSCRLTEGGRLEPSSGAWQNSGMGSPTEFLTLSTSEFHSGAVASSLSDILETGDLPEQYFLSARACAGILRRSERRGKELPLKLRTALEHRAMQAIEQIRTTISLPLARTRYVV